MEKERENKNKSKKKKGNSDSLSNKSINIESVENNKDTKKKQKKFKKAKVEIVAHNGVGHVIILEGIGMTIDNGATNYKVGDFVVIEYSSLGSKEFEYRIL